MTKTIAFLGLGAMGSRMVARLLEAGHDVTVFNRDTERATPLVERGAHLARTPAEAATGREVVISMVRDDEASRKVWLDPRSGALAHLDPAAIAVESSTLSPGHTEALAQVARESGRMFVDAPVVGTRPQAEAGKLIFLVGGAGSAVASLSEVFAAMGGATHHVGPTGAGMAMKLAVNALFGIQVAALAEIFGLLRSLGISDANAAEVLASMPITSAALAGVGRLMVARKFDPMFPIDLVEKDFSYMLGAARDGTAKLPLTAAARSVYACAKTDGLGDHNIVGVAKLYG